jgi:nitroreductase
MNEDLSVTPLAPGSVGLMEGMMTTRAIRRYADEPVPDSVLRDVLFAATRAPSGSNRQPFRFIVLTEGEKAAAAKALIARGARAVWGHKRSSDGYESRSGTQPSTPKSRMARTMQEYVDNLERVPALVLACLVRYREPVPTEGASVYPAVQNLLLGARALGYGGVLTGFHALVDTELKELLSIPSEVFIAASVTMGRPLGSHGPVRRAPLSNLVYGEQWGVSPGWAIDPPGTRHTSWS